MTSPWDVVRAPWSRWAWDDTRFLLTGPPACLPAAAIAALPWVFYIPISTFAVLLTTLVSFLLPLPAVWVLTAIQRWRFASFYGVEIPKVRSGGPLGFLRSESTWRQLAYHVVAGPFFALVGLLTALMWVAGFAGATFFIWIWALPSQYRLDHPGYTTTATYVTFAGIALVWAAPWLARAAATWDARAALALLGPGLAERLEQRVEDLTEKRAGLVDAADSERRRIERDLHDGAQQRLVSLAMNLGLARETLTDLSDEARQVIIEAHDEAKGALTELRDLVRGLHPAVLDDRGLDAALSGIAARAPLPVRLRVDVAARPSSTIEAVAYFVVSEALANVSKHAQAAQVEISVTRVENLLRVVVTDDGIGDADPARGTGLSGLIRRAASVDGTFRISSPAGGPTVITVELPCEP